MEGEVHQARKQDIPCFYARLSENLMAGKKNGAIVAITNGDKSIKVPAFVLPANDERDGGSIVLLPKVFRMALGVCKEDLVSVE